MSEVHKHEQAAVSPSFILNLTEATLELGTSSVFFWFLCLCFLVPVCVASGVKRGSPTSARGSCEKHSFIWTQV